MKPQKYFFKLCLIACVLAWNIFSSDQVSFAETPKRQWLCTVSCVALSPSMLEGTWIGGYSYSTQSSLWETWSALEYYCRQQGGAPLKSVNQSNSSSYSGSVSGGFGVFWVRLAKSISVSQSHSMSFEIATPVNSCIETDASENFTPPYLGPGNPLG